MTGSLLGYVGVNLWQQPLLKTGHGGQSTELLDCTDVPTHQKIPFILCGYRPSPRGALALLRTIFTLHNETGNMWTHLLGAVYFAVQFLQSCESLLDEDLEDAPMERVSILLLILASDFCLITSFVFHLCKCSSEGVCRCTLKLDLSGIVVLIGSSYFTGITLGFRCFPNLRCFWLVYSAAVVAALAAPVIKENIVEDQARHFIICVALGVLPAAHFSYLGTREDLFIVLPYLVAMFGCYAIGAWFYVQKFPERRWPGRFDLFGHSHQVWHVFVFLAAASWVQGCFVFLDHFGKKEC